MRRAFHSPFLHKWIVNEDKAFHSEPSGALFLLRYQRNAQATTNPHLGGTYCYKYTYTSISK